MVGGTKVIINAGFSGFFFSLLTIVQTQPQPSLMGKLLTSKRSRNRDMVVDGFSTSSKIDKKNENRKQNKFSTWTSMGGNKKDEKGEQIESQTQAEVTQRGRPRCLRSCLLLFVVSFSCCLQSLQIPFSIVGCLNSTCRTERSSIWNKNRQGPSLDMVLPQRRGSSNSKCVRIGRKYIVCILPMNLLQLASADAFFLVRLRPSHSLTQGKDRLGSGMVRIYQNGGTFDLGSIDMSSGRVRYMSITPGRRPLKRA